MARQSLLNEWWPYLLRMEEHIQQYRCKPHVAALKVVHDCGHKLPGHGEKQSKVKMLEERHRRYRDELKAELGPVPRTVELPIVVNSPQKVTLATRWFTRLVSRVKNTKTPAG